MKFDYGWSGGNNDSGLGETEVGREAGAGGDVKTWMAMMLTTRDRLWF